MDFRVGDDQRELAEGIRTMVAGRLPLDHVRSREGAASAISDEDWAALGETGVFALTLPEPQGTGLSMAEAVVVFEELGRALVPGPLVGTFLAARAGLVDGAAEGRSRVGVHGAEPGPNLVEHLDSLDALLVFTLVADAGGSRRGRERERGPVRLVAPITTEGATRVEAPLDPLTPMWRVDALPTGEPIPGDVGSLERDGALLTAALQVGHAAEALDLAVAYAKERQQFGTPIGSFQAVKHMCADMLVRVEVARAAVHAASCLVDAPDVVDSEAAVAGCTPDQLVDRSVGGAKLLADEAALANARTAIQVHGGMGFTWEVPLHLHLKRARVLSTTFGTPAAHAAALAASAGASSGVGAAT
jgi:alkylation response protein AidB-like acyl-CoA dehydrogenase